MSSLADLLEPTPHNSGTGGGIATEVYFVAEEDLSTQPERDSATDNVIADLVFAATNKATKIFATSETIEVKSDPLDGENDSVVAFENSASFFHPSIDEARLSFVNQISGKRGYFFVKDIATDKIIMIGEKGYPAKGKVASKFGKVVTEAKGLTFTFSARQPKTYCHYTGAGIGDDVVTP